MSKRGTKAAERYRSRQQRQEARGAKGLVAVDIETTPLPPGEYVYTIGGVDEAGTITMQVADASGRRRMIDTIASRMIPERREPMANDTASIEADTRKNGPRWAAQQIQEARNARDAAQRAQKEQAEFIEQLSESACLVGLCSVAGEKRLTVRIGTGLTVDAGRPPGEEGAKIGVGSFVRVVTPSNQVLGLASAPRVGATGAVTHVNEEEGLLEVSVNGTARAVVRAEAARTARIGDQVVVDETGYFALDMAAQPMKAQEFNDDTGISWDAIGGHAAAKEALREAIEYPIRYAALYEAYGRKPSKGVLLYGPPGCGKTMLGKATATAIRVLHGERAGAGGFLYVKGPELLNKYVGATEDAVRALFEKARRYKAETGHPAVLFIDEAEALLGRRGGRGFGLESTVVPTFLAEMDGLTDSGAFVMLSTNRPDSLDSAIVRDGRIDRRIEVRRPDREQALEILYLHLQGIPGEREIAFPEILDALYADTTIVQEIGKIHDHTLWLRMRDIMSGAVIAGVVGRAVERAIRRDREEEIQVQDIGCVSGLRTSDLLAAVRDSARELANTDHSQEMWEIVMNAVGQEKAQEWRNEKTKTPSAAGGLN